VHTLESKELWTGERVAGADRFNWRMLFYAAIAAIVVMLLLFVYGSDPALDYLFFVVPTVCLTILVLLLVVIIRKRTRHSLSMLLAAVVFLVAAGAMLKTQEELRPSLRWGLWSRRLKAQVLAQPSVSNEELKHIEWDGWGGAPVGDWTAYIVYDPTDSLAVEAKAGRSGSYKRLKGIPCEVDSVRRLEAHWYSVVLGMNEWWDRCGES
jgi:hypothetical protein